MDLTKLLNPKYFFAPIPNPDFQYATLLFIAGVILIVIGIGVRFYLKSATDAVFKKMLKHTPRFFILFGGVLILLVLIRIAGIPYMAMRLWWLIYGLLFLYFALTRLSRFPKEYQSRLKKIAESEKQKKYLPRKRIK